MVKKYQNRKKTRDTQYTTELESQDNRTQHLHSFRDWWCIKTNTNKNIKTNMSEAIRTNIHNLQYKHITVSCESLNVCLRWKLPCVPDLSGGRPQPIYQCRLPVGKSYQMYGWQTYSVNFKCRLNTSLHKFCIYNQSTKSQDCTLQCFWKAKNKSRVKVSQAGRKGFENVSDRETLQCMSDRQRYTAMHVLTDEGLLFT